MEEAFLYFFKEDIYNALFFNDEIYSVFNLFEYDFSEATVGLNKNFYYNNSHIYNTLNETTVGGGYNFVAFNEEKENNENIEYVENYDFVENIIFNLNGYFNEKDYADYFLENKSFFDYDYFSLNEHNGIYGSEINRIINPAFFNKNIFWDYYENSSITDTAHYLEFEKLFYVLNKSEGFEHFSGINFVEGLLRESLFKEYYLNAYEYTNNINNVLPLKEKPWLNEINTYYYSNALFNKNNTVYNEDITNENYYLKEAEIGGNPKYYNSDAIYKSCFPFDTEILNMLYGYETNFTHYMPEQLHSINSVDISKIYEAVNKAYLTENEIISTEGIAEEKKAFKAFNYKFGNDKAAEKSIIYDLEELEKKHKRLEEKIDRVRELSEENIHMQGTEGEKECDGLARDLRAMVSTEN